MNKVKGKMKYQTVICWFCWVDDVEVSAVSVSYVDALDVTRHICERHQEYVEGFDYKDDDWRPEMTEIDIEDLVEEVY